MTASCGARRRSVVSTSRSAAACGRSDDADRPRRRAAAARLRAASNSPSACKRRLQPQELLVQVAGAAPGASVRHAAANRRAPRRGRPRASTSTRSPSRGLNLHHARRAAEHDAHARWPRASFRVKYQCPLAGRERFEISPRDPEQGKPALQDLGDCPVQLTDGQISRAGRAIANGSAPGKSGFSKPKLSTKRTTA